MRRNVPPNTWLLHILYNRIGIGILLFFIVVTLSLDLFVISDMADKMLHVLLLILVFWVMQSRDIWISAGLCTDIIALDYYSLLEESLLWEIVFYRIVVIAAVWKIVILSLRQKKEGVEIQNAYKLLEKRMEERTKTLLHHQAALEKELAERSRKENQITASESRFRNLIEGSIQGIMIHRDGKLLFVNQSFAEIFGYPTPQAVLTSCEALDLVAPHERQRVLNLRASRLADKPTPSHYEYQGRRRDGRLIWLEGRMRKIIWEGAPAIQGAMVDVTARRQAEDDLRMAQFALDHCPYAIYWVDVNARFVYVNHAACAMLGYCQDELLTITVRDVDPEYPADTWAHWQRRKQQAPVTFESHQRTKNGRLFPVEVTVNYLEFNGREYMCGFVRDITKRKRSEEALKRSEERYRILVEGSIEGISIATYDRRRVFANQAYLDMMGYKNLTDYLEGPVMRTSAAHEHRRLQAYRDRRWRGDPAPDRYEFQAQRVDGKLFWVERRVSAIHWESAPAFIYSDMDITERKQAEQALRESEARYRMLVEGSIQGVVILSRDGRRLFANHAFAKMLGYESVDEYLHHPALNNMVPAEQERVKQHLRSLWRREVTTARAEFSAIRLDGATVWHEHLDSLIEWEGEPAVLSTVINITERKQAECERRRLEAQLHQGQKMEAIGTLAGGIAHDFNNILSAILGFAELILDEAPAESSISSDIQEVLKAGQRAKGLVQQILTFSRQGEMAQQPVHLPRLVQETLKLLRASLPSTIEIRQEIEEKCGLVSADVTQIYQILLNLCANAEHAMRDTGGMLTISVAPVEADADLVAAHPSLRPGPHVQLKLQDTGPGIPSGLLTRIFEPFFTTKQVGEGTGMGLAIVHGIVTSHNGALAVESAPGVGTTFTIYFPRINEVASSQTAAVSAMPRGAGRVLFVDDEDMLARLGQRLLEGLGYEVFPYTSSMAALAAFEASPEQFDVVITDQTMPQLSGDALARALRRIRPDIPIILCTGFSHIINAERAQALGLDAFCLKPLEQGELAMTLQQVLTQRDDHGL